MSSLPGIPLLEEQLKKCREEAPIDAASRLASLAEQYEHLKSYEAAQQCNLQANTYYLEALANLKQRNTSDREALTTLELLAETHRRKAKILALRGQYEGKSQVELVKERIKDLRKEKKKA
jgi:hypothetical protein